MLAAAEAMIFAALLRLSWAAPAAAGSTVLENLRLTARAVAMSSVALLAVCCRRRCNTRGFLGDDAAAISGGGVARCYVAHLQPTLRCAVRGAAHGRHLEFEREANDGARRSKGGGGHTPGVQRTLFKVNGKRLRSGQGRAGYFEPTTTDRWRMMDGDPGG